MQEKRKPFKQPPKKYQPKGITILYEDHDILVVNKVNGLLTIGTDREKHKTAYYLLDNYVKKGNHRSKKRIFIVHRLDRDTSGVLVFAKNEHAKHYLQGNWKDFGKSYFAVVNGVLKKKEGIITSWLRENKAYQVYSVKDPDNGKLAKTGYKVIRESDKYSLLNIDLFTGRKNQIRVHLSENGHPVLGDNVYGNADKGIKRLALHAAALHITHPFSKEKMSFETGIPTYFKTLLKA